MLSFLLNISKVLITFKQQGWHLQFITWFKKNVLFEKKKVKLWNTWHFVERTTEIMQHVLKNIKSPCCLHI